MHDEPATPDARLTGFEAQLAALTPVARVDRDQLMFAAGERAAIAQSRRAHRLLAGGNALLAAALAVVWIVPQPSQPPAAAIDARTFAGRAQRDKAVRQVHSMDGDLPFVAVDGPTNLRLRQKLAADASIRWVGEHSETTGNSTGPGSIPSNDLRVMQRRHVDWSGQL